MAQTIERLLETTVEQLHIFQKWEVLTEHEARKISHKRRNLERSLIQNGVTWKNYFRYIQYEHNVRLLLKRRLKKLGKKATTRSESRILKRALFQQTNRIFTLFNRASRKFPTEWIVWKNYFKYCLQTNSFRLASRVLGRALARLPNLEELWLIAISFEFDHRKNMHAARIVAQRSLRQLENSQLLWKEYFRIELYYLCQQIFQRQYLGVPIPQEAKANISQGNTHETTDEHILLPDDDVEEDNQLVLDEELHLVYQDISQQSSTLLECKKTSSVSLSFWEGGIVLLILKHILQRWQSDDQFLASLVELVMETPFTPQVLKSEVRSLVLSQLRTCENCRLALVKGWFHLDSSSSIFQPDKIIDEFKGIIRDIPKRDVLNRCCDLMDSFSLQENNKKSFLEWVHSLNSDLVENSEGTTENIQDESLNSLITTWQNLKDESERKDMECFILSRLEQEILHNSSVDVKQALLLIRFLSGEMGTLTSLNNLECIEKVRKLYDRLLYLHPMNVSIIRMAIYIEERQSNDIQSVQRLRKLFDAWCEVEGRSCVDSWLEYITFERKLNETRKVAQLYWKALKMLQNKTEFLERFSLLCTKPF